MAVKRILVAVTGMSPQIVTETLFALWQQGWQPDEVHVLTTLPGKQRLVDALFGERAFFRRFCTDYAVDGIDFSPDFVHVMTDDEGTALADIRSPAENNLAADRIVRFIHDLCLLEDSELHVSIAGGRKSMGFYIGYALSLFGRRQDRLSHVLVNEPFEGLPDFFYPPPMSQWIVTRDEQQVDAHLAEVMLADIPFVRMREGAPRLALDAGWNYLQAVQQTQQRMTDWRLEIDAATLTVRCGGSAPIVLTPQLFALYAAMAELRMEDVAVRKEQAEDMALLALRFARWYERVADGGRSCPDLCKDDFAEMKRVLQEGSSEIFKRLRKALGSYARVFRIEGKGRNNRKCYALVLDKAQIVWL